MELVMTDLDKILQHMDEQGIDRFPGYEIELGLLIDQLELYQDAMEQGKTFGWYNKFDNGTVQRNAYATQVDKCLGHIDKLANKFGLNPKALKMMKIEKKKKGKLDAFKK